MAIANELSGDVAIAVLARAGNAESRDSTKLKEILINFYSALHSLKASSPRKHARAKAAASLRASDSVKSDGQ